MLLLPSPSMLLTDKEDPVGVGALATVSTTWRMKLVQEASASPNLASPRRFLRLMSRTLTSSNLVDDSRVLRVPPNGRRRTGSRPDEKWLTTEGEKWSTTGESGEGDPRPTH